MDIPSAVFQRQAQTVGGQKYLTCFALHRAHDIIERKCCPAGIRKDHKAKVKIGTIRRQDDWNVRSKFRLPGFQKVFGLTQRELVALPVWFIGIAAVYS